MGEREDSKGILSAINLHYAPFSCVRICVIQDRALGVCNIMFFIARLSCMSE